MQPHSHDQLSQNRLKKQVILYLSRVLVRRGVRGAESASGSQVRGRLRDGWRGGRGLLRAFAEFAAAVGGGGDGGTGYTTPQAAIAFALAHPAVTTVIPGMRSIDQTEADCAVSDLPPMPHDLLVKLRKHRWNRAFWYAGQ